MFSSQSTTTTINGQPVKIHGFTTGAVAVKSKFLEAKRKGILAQLDILFDKVFTQWLPVWVWVVEHPEGIYVIDTGVSPDVMKAGYFKILGWFSNWVNTTLFKFKITNEDSPQEQLKQLGIPIQNIKAVILTHLHIDHVDGLKYFKGKEILVNKLEWEKPSGDVPKLYPEWFAPSLVELNDTLDVFKNVRSLTTSNDLLLIHTPGHTNGHTSILLKTDKANILFAGDICYYHDQINKNLYAGANSSRSKAEDTYKNIREFAKNNKVVFLPSHDPEAASRLKTLTSLQV